MRKVAVQAYEDLRRPEGGHGVVLLQGLTKPQGVITYRIRVADPTRVGGGGWIGGEHVPVHTSVSERGLELVVGPSITESEHLLPGTVVEIEVPSCSARGEFLWPNIAPLLRPKRKTIATSRPRPTPKSESRSSPAASAAAPERATPSSDLAHTAIFDIKFQAAPRVDIASTMESSAAALATLARTAASSASEAIPVAASPDSPEPSPTRQPLPPVDQPGRVKTQSESKANEAQSKAERAAAPQVADGDVLDQPVTRALRADHGLTSSIAAADAGTPRAVVPANTDREGAMPKTPPHETMSHGQDAEERVAEEIASKHGWAFRKDVGIMLSKKFFALGASRHDEVQDEAVHATRESGHHSIAAEATAILAHKEEAETHSTQVAIDDWPVPVPADVAPVMVGRGEASSGYYAPAHAGHARAPGAQAALTSEPGAVRGGFRMSVPAAITLSTLIIGGIAWVALLAGKGTKDAIEKSVRTMDASAAIAAPRSGNSATDPGRLYDAFAVGATSPRGVSVSGISALKALENANSQLLSASRDTEEGAFWLRQYLNGTLADERTTRALTQLGSLYAEPSGKAPDYAKARLLWEIASAAGDPVAHCFLGLLHENGLGVPADRSAARQWYQRAKEKGGCPDVDQSIARVSQ